MDAGSYESAIAQPWCVINGRLKQKNKSGDWNERYCAVWKKYFICYKSENDAKPQAAFILDGFHIEEYQVAANNQFLFELSKPGVVAHVFAADSEQTLKKWTEILKDSISSSISNDRCVIGGTDSLHDSNKKMEHSAEDDKTATSLNFPAVDIALDKVLPLPTLHAFLHTSQSYDSGLKPNENINFWQRSEEIEDLRHYQEDVDDDEQLIMTVQDSEVNRNSDVINADVKSEAAEGYENEEEQLSSRDRGKSLVEEVFEALGIQEETPEEKKPEATVDGLLAAVGAVKDFMRTNKVEEDNETKGSSTATNEKKKDLLPLSSIKKSEDIEKYKTTHGNETNNKQPLVQTNQSTETSDEKNKNVKIPSRIPEIKGFVKIADDESSEWVKVWAELKSHHIEFKNSPNSSLNAKIIPIKNLQLHPAAWDTGRLLTFKLTRCNKLQIIMELILSNLTDRDEVECEGEEDVLLPVLYSNSP